MSADNVLLAVPNISEGRDQEKVARIAGTGAVLLDIHSDVDHNRSVLTYGGEPDAVVATVASMIERAVRELDLREQEGAHPRYGAVDVLPFVPYSVSEDVALKAALSGVVRTTADNLEVPIYFYGRAAYDPDEGGPPSPPEEGLSLPNLRRLLREFQPLIHHPSAGAICVGVRDPLIAFNVNFEGSLDEAKRVAREIRGPGVRALGFELPSRKLVQVSMNLVAPLKSGPAETYEQITRLLGRPIIDCEVVGLVPELVINQLVDLPLRVPPRSVEQALDRRPGP